MLETELDELYALIGRIFPNTDPERIFRIRANLRDSSLAYGTARELVFQHRETHEHLTEPHLLDEIRRVDPLAKTAQSVASDAAVRRQRKQREQWEREKIDDDARLVVLKSMPPEKISELSGRVLAKLSEASRQMLVKRDPLLSLMMRGLMAVEAGIGGQS